MSIAERNADLINKAIKMAVAVLAEICENSEADPGDRLQTACSLLNFAGRVNKGSL